MRGLCILPLCLIAAATVPAHAYNFGPTPPIPGVDDRNASTPTPECDNVESNYHDVYSEGQGAYQEQHQQIIANLTPLPVYQIDLTAANMVNDGFAQPIICVVFFPKDVGWISPTSKTQKDFTNFILNGYNLNGLLPDSIGIVTSTYPDNNIEHNDVNVSVIFNGKAYNGGMIGEDAQKLLNRFSLINFHTPILNASTPFLDAGLWESTFGTSTDLVNTITYAGSLNPIERENSIDRETDFRIGKLTAAICAAILGILAHFFFTYVERKRATIRKQWNEWPDTKKWHYDENTGEFYRITEHLPDGQIIFIRESYQERWQHWFRVYRISRRNNELPLIALVFLFSLYEFTVAWGNNKFVYAYLWGSFVFIVGVGFATIIGLYVSAYINTEDKISGPKPRPRQADNFGPSSASIPAKHPTSDDLTYRPSL